MSQDYLLASELEAAQTVAQLGRRGFTASWRGDPSGIVLTLEGPASVAAEEVLIGWAPSARHVGPAPTAALCGG